MTRRHAPLASTLLATLALAACADQPTTAPALRASADVAPTDLVVEDAPARGGFALPAGVELADAPDLLAGADAINPKDYVCSSNSAVNAWINGKISQSLAVEQGRFLTAYNYLADQVPTYEALYFQTTATPQYFGRNGEHTKGIGKVERDIKRFWAINSSDIQVVGMHGSVLTDTLRTKATYQLFGYPAASAAGFARTMRNAIVGSQTMVNGDHPFFTFNAVAFTTFGGSVPDKIVMGDGILQVYDELGFGDVAPQAIFAHEFAHHVQFEKGYKLAVGTAGEKTRYNELGADLMAAYFLTHARGLALNKHRVEEFLQVFYQIGDCSFSSSGHHGTPNQRLAAARRGFELADQAQKQGHIMTPEQVQAVFVAAYPTIIAPDAH